MKGKSVTPSPVAAPLQINDANRRLALERLPAPVLSSLRWPGRPELPAGNPAWTFMVHYPIGEFALFVGGTFVMAAGVLFACGTDNGSSSSGALPTPDSAKPDTSSGSSGTSP